MADQDKAMGGKELGASREPSPATGAAQGTTALRSGLTPTQRAACSAQSYASYLIEELVLITRTAPTEHRLTQAAEYAAKVAGFVADMRRAHNAEQRAA